MVPIAVIEHQVPGRVRLRLPDRRGDDGYFADLLNGLSGHPAVRTVKADAKRGSLVIHHEEDADTILHAAGELFEVLDSDDPRVAKRLAREPQVIGLLELSAATMSLAAFYQLRRGRTLGPASDNFWNAFRAHHLLRRRYLAMGYAAFGAIQLLRSSLLSEASSLAFNALLARYMVDTAQRRRRFLQATSARAALRRRRPRPISGA